MKFLIKNKYPVESLLREPVEWWSAVVFSLAGVTAAVLPSTFLFTPIIAYLVSAFLLAFGIKRFMQGYYIVRYRKNLTKLPYYALSSKEIPFDAKKMFLGRGFRWRAIHTQRLLDCQRIGAERYIKSAAINKTNEMNGNPVLHGVELNEQNVWMNLTDRVGHMVVFGTTRVGKTRFAEIQIAQDIKRGDTVIVFDPKGDADLLLRIYVEAKLSNRENDVLVFHLGFPEHSARYNPIGNFARVTEVANRVTKQLPAEGESAAFREFAWQFVNIVAKTLVVLGRKITYSAIKSYILNIDPLLLDYCKQNLVQVDPNWNHKVQQEASKINVNSLPNHMKNRSKYMIALVDYLKKNRGDKSNDTIIEGLCSIFDHDKTYYNKITASLIPLLEKLTTGQTTALISPDYDDLDDKRPLMDWMQVIRGKKIVYVGLDALSDSTVAGAVGSSMFSDLTSVAGQIYKYGVAPRSDKKSAKKSRHLVCVYADEFNEIANDDVVTALNKGGGAGFQMTLLTQTWDDIVAKLVVEAKAQQVGGNLNTLICMRVQNERTASYFTNKLPQKIEIRSITEASSVTDSSSLSGHHDFTSSNEDRISVREVAMLTAADLMQLPKGHAFCLIAGWAWKVRAAQPKQVKEDLVDIPDYIAQMAGCMRRIYDKDIDKWQQLCAA